MKKRLMKPAFGESSIFHAMAPMKDGSMNGTRNMLFMNRLCGISVRVTSHAKKVPTIVEPMVDMPAMISEFINALKVSGSFRMSMAPEKLKWSSTQNALNRIRSTGNATTMTRMAMDRNRMTCATPKELFVFIPQAPPSAIPSRTSAGSKTTASIRLRP